MAKFLALIYGDEKTWAEASDEWNERNGERHRVFNLEAGSAVIAGHELESTNKAVSLRPDDDGEVASTDGPFVETKEVIGGFYVLEAASIDEAIKLASGIPEASTASSGVEVRPIRA
jgi:hypothetical protein